MLVSIFLLAAFLTAANNIHGLPVIVGDNQPSIFNNISCNTNNKTVEYHLQFTQDFHKPDGVRRQSILINGQFPGPTIRVRRGDCLLLHIDNQLFYEGLSIHIHGLHNQDTPGMDGVAFGTQRPIPAGEKFTYRHYIHTNPPGTYWYHSHYQLQSHSVFGAFIIEDDDHSDFCNINDNYRYSSASGEGSNDKILLLSDWYHQSDEEQLIGLLSPQFKWVGNPQSLLINGQGRYNCSLLTDPNLSKDCQPPPYPVVSLDADRVRSTRIRVIAATSLSYLSLRIGGHRMEIFEVDGMLTEPLTVDELEINSGQRYSIRLLPLPPQPSGGGGDSCRVFRMDLGVRWRPTGPTAIGLLQYIPDKSELAKALSDLPLYPPDSLFNPPSRPDWVLDQLKPLVQNSNLGYYQAPPVGSPSQTIILRGKQANISLASAHSAAPHNSHNNSQINNRSQYYMKWLINDQFWTPPTDKSLLESFMDQSMYTNGNPSNIIDLGPLVFPIQYGDVVDVVLQNIVSLNGICEQHPWHLHGHHFWDYGGGPGLYNPNSAVVRELIRHKLPIMRDTTTLFPYDSAYFQQNNVSVPTGVASTIRLPPPSPLPPGSPCGWRLIRFKADNPGLWNFHCHISSHMHMGMQVFFLEAADRLRQLMNGYSIGRDGQWMYLE